MAAAPPTFRYWVDELLWSQGRVATTQIEQVLERMGGERTGGPHKQLKQQSAPASSALSLPGALRGLQLQDADGASSSKAAEAAGQPGGGSSDGGSSRSSSRSSSQHSLAASPGDAAAAASDAAAEPPDDSEPCSEPEHSGPGAGFGPGGPAKRPDDHLLGYHHVDDWELLWTKSVFAIKAARSLRPGQQVSAIAGLNCLTMKKRMVQTMRAVSCAARLPQVWRVRCRLEGCMVHACHVACNKQPLTTLKTTTA